MAWELRDNPWGSDGELPGSDQRFDYPLFFSSEHPIAATGQARDRAHSADMEYKAAFCMLKGVA